MNDETATRSRATYTRLILALVVVLAVGFAGWWLGRSGPVAQVGELTVQLEQAETRAESAERERDQTVAAADLQKAHISLLEALNELDRRNFGLVEGRMETVRDRLAAVDPVALGVDPVALEQLRAEVAAVEPTVSADLNEQREKLLAIAARFAELGGD